MVRKKGQKRECVARKNNVPSQIQRTGGREKKDRSSFYYIYNQQNFAKNNPYCTGQGHGQESILHGGLDKKDQD